MNNITVIGNLGRDPELKYAQSGTAVLKFSVADTRTKGDEKITQWWNNACFGDLAENGAASISKGNRVQVMGKVQREKYTDKEGVERERVEVLADDVGLSRRWEPAGEAAPSREPLLKGATVVQDSLEEPF